MKIILIFIIVILIILIFIKFYFPHVLASGNFRIDKYVNKLKLEDKVWLPESVIKKLRNVFIEKAESGYTVITDYYVKKMKKMNLEIDKGSLNDLTYTTFEDFIRKDMNEIMENYTFAFLKLLTVYNKNVRVRTSIENIIFTHKNDKLLPKGMKILEASIDVLKIQEKFNKLIEEKKIKLENLHEGNNGIYYLNFFDYIITVESEETKIKRNFVEEDSTKILKVLQEIDKELYEIIISWLKLINYEKYGDFWLNIMQYHDADLKGLRSHFDTILQAYGPIFTINIGEEIYYDMFPVFVPRWVEPVSVRIPKGSIVGLTGDSRYRWTHGLPDGFKNINGKYSIVLRFKNFTTIPKEDLEVVDD